MIRAVDNYKFRVGLFLAIPLSIMTGGIFLKIFFFTFDSFELKKLLLLLIGCGILLLSFKLYRFIICHLHKTVPVHQVN